MGVGSQRHAPAALPPGMTRYPLYRRLDIPQGRSGLVLKISPPPGFDPRTVQLVASRFTDYDIPAETGTQKVVNWLKSTNSESFSLNFRSMLCKLTDAVRYNVPMNCRREVT
jgi:hypothetical protein